MTRYTTLTIALIVYFCAAGTTMADSYRFDFSGTMFGSNESYSGYAILDYSTPNVSIDPGLGVYENAITQFELQFGSASYTFDQNDGNAASIVNDSDYAGVDGFSISLYLTDTADGSEAGLFFLQLNDSSMSVFSSLDLPTSLSISDFDLTTDNTYPSGVFVTNESDYLNPIDFVHLAPVPVPAGLLLLLSGLGTFFAFSNVRN